MRNVAFRALYKVSSRSCLVKLTETLENRSQDGRSQGSNTRTNSIITTTRLYLLEHGAGISNLVFKQLSSV